MYNIIGAKNLWFTVSGLLMTASIFFIVQGGLKLGIDFTGGSLLQISFQEQPPAQDISNTLKDLELGDITIQPAEENAFVLRLKEIDNPTRETILLRLKKRFGETTDELSFETIGPTIGKELRRKAVLSILIALVAIILYIAWAFRNVSTGPVPASIFGIAAIVALIHDILITTGVFAILGRYRGIEVGSLFVTALLTILGFSVHDTIVVYDRIRERLLKFSKSNFKDLLNESIHSTLGRSLNTSITTLLVLIALYLFGGESIRYFILALIIGIVTGTYSSIFIASPLLLVWQTWKNKKRSVT